MKPNNKLQTPLSKQLFDFLKTNLHDFIPGKEIKPATKTKKVLKASFYQIIRNMARQWPKFLTDLIFQSNPNIDKNATIPFDVLESMMKKLILKFTTILFTKLNYAEIFASPYTIPPYKTNGRLQFCMNLARIHLHLSENYQQALNYTKFAEDFNLRPMRFTISSAINAFDQEEKYLTIKQDKKFNIILLFNIPKTQFLEKFNIPSLKNSLEYFENWFEKFFPIYNQQFDEPLNKTKVHNALKHQFRLQFIKQLTLLLPTEYEIVEPQSFDDRRTESIKCSNHHILTCKDEACIFLVEGKHDFPTLLKRYTDYSYELFPKKESEVWKEPSLKIEIFELEQEHEASFSKLVLT